MLEDRIQKQINVYVILGGNGDVMLLAEGFRPEEKGKKKPGEVGGPELDAWDEPCFCVCQPAEEEEGRGGCCSWRRRSLRTCFSLKEK